ncbi:MAG: M1 family metallopeptidase [Polyangia bacterium]
MRALLVLLALTSTALATPPTLRLGDEVKPVRYAVALTIDPRATSFDGVVDVELDVRKAIDTVWMNAENITVLRASIDGAPVRVVADQPHFVGFVPGQPLPVKHAKLHIEYRAVLSDTETTGVVRQHDGRDDYVFTQFEPIDARHAFPCFDEPGVKVPWQLTLTVRSADGAFSNMPIVSEKDLGRGWKRVQFAETPAIPSYLVAFIVGPFDVVDAGKSATSGTPIRIVVPRGKSSQVRWPASVTHEVLEQLEAYFGSAHPFPKLDIVAVPHTSYGAMENPGLVMFTGELVLQAPGDETISRRRAYAEVAMHELAHQWFGNLVTMKWWNDVWLNEAFATWLTSHLMERWQPTWAEAEARIESRDAAMAADSLAATRAVRQPIASSDDIQSVFNRIVYEKGSTVIGMFERLVGTDHFRDGVRRYLALHARGNADTHDFLVAISDAGAQAITAAFATFIDQPGTPSIKFALDCRGKTPVLHMTQQRYTRLGSTMSTQQLWQVPVCVRWPDGHTCKVLTGKYGDLPLTGATSCPAWVEPNDGGAGYYRVEPSLELLAGLENGGMASLTVPEKMSLLSDVSALSSAGHIDYTEVLALAGKLAHDPDRHVVGAALDAVGWLDQAGWLTGRERPAYRLWMHELFGKRAHELGLSPHKDDSEDTRLLRAQLVPTYIAVTGDPVLLAEARKLAAAWLKDPHAITPDLVDGVLDVVGRSGTRAQWNAWMKAARATKERPMRLHLVNALGSMRDPALVRSSLATLESDGMDLRDALGLLWGAASQLETRAIAWTWLQAHFDALVPRLPRDAAARLVSLTESACDDALVEPTRAFFGERVKKLDGGVRELELALEGQHLCSVFRTAQLPLVQRWFSKKH